MKKGVHLLFVLLSRGILNGPGVRLRTELLVTWVLVLGAWTSVLVLLRLLHASSLLAGGALFLVAGATWPIGRFARRYVNNNWRWFSPRAKANVQHLWAWRSLAYGIMLGLILAASVSGYWWGKDHARAERETRQVH